MCTWTGVTLNGNVRMVFKSGNKFECLGAGVKGSWQAGGANIMKKLLSIVDFWFKKSSAYFVI